MARPIIPIDPGEGFALLDGIASLFAQRVVLAVSGGPDSTALLALAGENRRCFAARGRRFLVVTVDHGLRPESACEAREVARLAARYDLEHRTLRWTPAGLGNPSAAARGARYRLLTEAAEAFGAGAIVTAHHQDDQLETHMMARERGEGPLRLAGMRACRAVAPGLVLCRPFLGVPKARLVASLEARGLPWTDDPTNVDPRYRRAVWRGRLAAMPQAGRDDILAQVAAAAAARTRLELEIARLLTRLTVFPDGAIEMDRPKRADEAGRGLLSRALSAAGGASAPASGRKVARLAERLDSGGPLEATLGGCRVDASGPRLRIVREFGRAGPPILPIAGARRVVFDGRFDVDIPESRGAGHLVPLGALGRGGVRDATLPVLLDAAGAVLSAHPSARARLSGTPAALTCRERVSWRLARDLPRPDDVIQIAAKPPRLVGKEMAADYLAI